MNSEIVFTLKDVIYVIGLAVTGAGVYWGAILKMQKQDSRIDAQQKEIEVIASDNKKIKEELKCLNDIRVDVGKLSENIKALDKTVSVTLSGMKDIFVAAMESKK